MCVSVGSESGGCHFFWFTYSSVFVGCSFSSKSEDKANKLNYQVVRWFKFWFLQGLVINCFGKCSLSLITYSDHGQKKKTNLLMYFE